MPSARSKPKATVANQAKPKQPNLLLVHCTNSPGDKLAVSLCNQQIQFEFNSMHDVLFLYLNKVKALALAQRLNAMADHLPDNLDSNIDVV